MLEHTEPHMALKPNIGSQLCSRSLPKAWTLQHQPGLVFSFTVDHHPVRWSRGDIRVVVLSETSLCLHGLGG